MKSIRSTLGRDPKLTVEIHQTLPEMIATPFRVLISNLPSQYDVGHLALIIKKVARVENTVDFTVAAETDFTAMVTFKKKLSKGGTHLIVVNEW